MPDRVLLTAIGQKWTLVKTKNNRINSVEAYMLFGFIYEFIDIRPRPFIHMLRF